MRKCQVQEEKQVVGQKENLNLQDLCDSYMDIKTRDEFVRKVQVKDTDL